jgi:hypothetical protein
VTKTLEVMKSIPSGDLPNSLDIFLRMKEKVNRSFKNFAFSQPYMHCIIGTLNCLEDPRWTNAEKYVSHLIPCILNFAFKLPHLCRLEALGPVTIADFNVFTASLLRQIHCEILVHGNATEIEAKETIAKPILDTLQSRPLPYAEEPIRRVVLLEPGVEYIWNQYALHTNPAEVNSAIENVYFIAEDTSIADFPPESSVEGDAASNENANIGWTGIRAAALLALLAHMVLISLIFYVFFLNCFHSPPNHCAYH